MNISENKVVLRVELCLNNTAAMERILPDHVLEFKREVRKCVKCTRAVLFGKLVLCRHSPLEWRPLY
jgi:hypothetical protein